MPNLKPILDRVDTTHHWICRGNGHPPEHVDIPLPPELHGKPYARGACPIRRGESTTRLALLDLDSHKGETPWPEMAKIAGEVLSQAAQRGLKGTPVRSSGGNGIHLYFLWKEPQDAFSVRMQLRDVLAACGYTDGTAGVAKREIEVFPKQDSVAPEKSGSMFVLPFANKSVPLDPLDFTPTDDVVWRASAPVPKRERKKRELRPELAGRIDTQQLAKELGRFDPDCSHDDWIELGMVCHYKSNGEDWGLQVWDDWSARSEKNKYPGYEHLEYRWSTFGNHPEPKTQFPQRPADPSDFDVVSPVAPAELATANPPGAQRRRYEFVPLDEFTNRPPVQWHIKKVVPKATLGVIYGQPGSGKTFLTLNLAVAIARGTDWRKRKVKQGRVLYVCAEDANGFAMRVTALAHQLGVDKRDIDIKVLANSPNVFDLTQAIEIAQEVNLAGGASVVVLDTMTATTSGADQNAQKDMTVICDHCAQISRVTGAMVLLVHHSGKDESRGMRGSNVLHGAADVEIEVTEVGETRVATIVKQKNGQEGEQFAFKLVPVLLGLDDDGEDITSCVVEHVETVPTVKKNGKREPRGLPSLVYQVARDLTINGDWCPEESLWAKCVDQMPEPAKGQKDRRAEDAKRAARNSLAGTWLEFQGGKFRVI